MEAGELTTGASAEELARLAASIPIPVAARGAPRAYVEVIRDGPEHTPNARCDHRYVHQVALGLEGGRRRELVGPLLESPREAIRLAAILNGRRATAPSAPSASAGPPRPTAAPEPVPTPVLPPELAKALEAGKLEQTCRTCGRWEAASFLCSWCRRPTGPDDWYRNSDVAERRGRMPAVAPVDPPIEYLAGAANWPAPWGPFPRRQKPGRKPGTPIERVIAEPVDVRAAQPSPKEARRSVAGQLSLDLIAKDEMTPAHVIAAAKRLPARLSR
jgi:hypothetical protein